jgi:hypothetical protein
LIYADVGDKIDFASFIVGVTSKHQEDLTIESVRVETTADMRQEGIYSVHYYVNDSSGAQGHSILNVIVG